MNITLGKNGVVIEAAQNDLNIPELIPKNDDERAVLDALKNTGKYANRYQTKEDLDNAVDAKIILDEELHKGNWTDTDIKQDSWHKVMHDAFIKNEENAKNHLRNIGINSPKDFLRRREMITENFLTQPDLDPSTYEPFENATMLLTPEQFGEQILKPINTYKAGKKIDLGVNLIKTFKDYGDALDETLKLKNDGNEEEVIRLTNEIVKSRQAGAERFMREMASKDAMNKLWTNAGFGRKAGINPKYVHADPRANFNLRIMTELASRMGFPDGEHSPGLIKHLRKHFTLADGSYAFDLDNFIGDDKLPEIKQKMLQFPAVYSDYIVKNRIPLVQTTYRGKELFADDTDTLQRNAARKRKTYMDFINKRFKKPENELDPVEMGERQYQIAAALTALEDANNGQAAKDVLQGIKFLDDIPASTIIKIGAKARKKGYYSEMLRHKLGEEIERKSTQTLNEARNMYKAYIGDNQYPHRTNIVYKTPILTEKNTKTKKKNFKLLAGNDYGEALDRELDHRQLTSPMPYDPNNKDMVGIRNGLNLETFPKVGEGIQKIHAQGYDDVYGYRYRLENGKEVFNIIWKGHFKHPFSVNLHDVSRPHILTQQEIDAQKVAKSNRVVPELNDDLSSTAFNAPATQKEKKFARIANDQLIGEAFLVDQRKHIGPPPRMPVDPAVKAMRDVNTALTNQIANDREHVDYQYRKANNQLTKGEKVKEFGKGVVEVGKQLARPALMGAGLYMGAKYGMGNPTPTLASMSTMPVKDLLESWANNLNLNDLLYLT